jgi:hypothetical protein
MAKKQIDGQELKIERPKRAKLSTDETLKRMEAFDERKEQFVASVRCQTVARMLPNSVDEHRSDAMRRED